MTGRAIPKGGRQRQERMTGRWEEGQSPNMSSEVCSKWPSGERTELRICMHVHDTIIHPMFLCFW
jgi:hypothetical protein